MMKCKRCKDETCTLVFHTKCKKCGTTNCYNEKYDAYFCSKCNKWLESVCRDPNCDYCTERPKKPMKVN